MSTTTTSLPATSIDLGSHYSMIITPDNYNQIISHEHLYIAASDNFIKHTIAHQIADITDAEVVELGCGPARLLPIMTNLKNIHLTLVDVDSDFLAHATKLANELSSSATIIQSDVSSYQHLKPVNIFYSQGMHHHIAKGKLTHKYLKNVYNQLISGGLYILSDEFLPDYGDEKDREIKAIIWYAHIIAHALKHNFTYLAQEEAKTLLDDLSEGHPDAVAYKSEQQIQTVLNAVSHIDTAALKTDFVTANQLANKLLLDLANAISNQPSGNQTLDLSRKDYKICEHDFKKEIAEVGFTIETQRFFGIDKKIGGMVVYVLKKL